MQNANSHLVHVAPEKRSLDVEQSVLVFRHELASSVLFSDAALAELIDEHPHEDLHVHTMSGTNESPSYLDAEIGSLSGAEVVSAIQRGRIWLSVVHVERHPAYGELLDALYGQLEAQSSIRTVSGTRLANLLISSPTAEVFYHADAQPNVLWHIRGRKQLIVYPPWDSRFLSQENRELCLLGMLMDDAYRSEHDRHATTFDMAPGDAVTWPQTTPHRVVNVDGFNVSISSEHHTAASKRRQRVAAANWFLRHRLGLPTRSLQTGGAVPALKRATYLACKAVRRALGGGSLVPVDADPMTTIRLDARDPRGYVEIAGR